MMIGVTTVILIEPSMTVNYDAQMTMIVKDLNGRLMKKNAFGGKKGVVNMSKIL